MQYGASFWCAIRPGPASPPVLVALFFMLVPSTLDAQKTDVLTMRNGDQVTGEMKTLRRGLLEFKTDAMGTTSVKWRRVVTAETDKRFTITLEDGRIYYGSLQPGTADSVVIRADSLSVTVATVVVVDLERFERSFWNRLNGRLGIGFAFTQQNAKTDLNLNGRVKYVQRANLTRLDFSSTFSRQDDTEDIERFDGSLAHFRQFKKRWFFLGFLSAARNSQLSLDIRGGVGGGVGRLLVQSNRVDLGVFVAPSVARERFTGESGDTSFPLVFAADFLLFIWEPLSTEITSRLGVLPILGESGRWRVDFTLNAEREIFSDFYIDLGIVELFDSRPPSINANKNDFSLTTSLGWKF